MKSKSKARSRASKNTGNRGIPSQSREAVSAFDEKFALGHEHFNSRRFFEAHESWEEIWLKSHGLERRRLQGIIQIAAAFHHHSRNNLAGTESLLRAGLSKIEDAPAVHWGVHLDSLRTSVRRWIANLQKAAPIAGKIPPKILRAK